MQKVYTHRAALAAVLVAALTAFIGSRAQASQIADSQSDFPIADNATSASKQGINNWTYGYHNVTANGAYTGANFIPFPDNAGPGTSASDFWTGTTWDWHAGNPTWTQLYDTGRHPNGINHTVEH